MDIGTFKTNQQAEQEGVWVDAGEGLKLLIGRITNRKYIRLVQKLGMPHGRRLAAGRVDPELLEGITTKAIAKHVLLDWKNLQEQGKDVPYSVETAERFLTEMPDFKELVTSFASDRELFIKEQEEAAAGNSESVSPGP